MKAKVSYVINYSNYVEITEEMIRELYDKYKNYIFARSLVMDAIDEYLARESEYMNNNGRNFKYNCDEIYEWIDKVIDKIKEEEK